MDCITCRTSSAPLCSSSAAIYSSFSRVSPQDPCRIPKRCYLSLRSSSRPVITVRSSSSSNPPTKEVPSSFSAPNLAADKERGGVGGLSAKDRRKLRNERREAAKTSQEQPWRNAVEDKLLEKKKKIRNWREDADINRCAAKGVQWWMIQTTRKYEFDVAEQIDIIFPEKFPGKEFEVIVPTVPVKTKLKDGTVSQSRKKVYEGIVLLRCLLDREVYVTVKQIPRAYEFFGNQAGLSLMPIVMPAPVSNFNMEVMFEKIRKQEKEYEDFKEQCRIELEEERREKERVMEEKKRRDAEEKLLKSKGLILNVGSTVRVLSGPFLDFTGVVTELLPNKKIKAIVTVFGNDTPIVLDVEEVIVESPAGDQRTGRLY